MQRSNSSQQNPGNISAQDVQQPVNKKSKYNLPRKSRQNNKLTKGSGKEKL
jgi:hypothetical protein